MLPRTVVIGALMLSISAVVYDLTGLEHPLVFSPDKPALSTIEILKPTEWDLQPKDDFHSGGKHWVRLQETPEPVPGPKLAVLRLKSLQAVLDAIGIGGDKVESSEADIHLRVAEHEGATPHMLTVVYVVFQPDRQSPCCPGAAPAAPFALKR